MFNFMKKHDKEGKEKKKDKKDKKEKTKKEKQPMTQDELNRLDEVKKGLFRKRSDRAHKGDGDNASTGSAGSADSPRASWISRSSHRQSPEVDSAGSNESTPREEKPIEQVFTSQKKIELQSSVKASQPPKAKPRSILKDKSHYAPGMSNQVSSNVDDKEILEANTALNEDMSGVVGKTMNITVPVPPSKAPSRPPKHVSKRSSAQHNGDAMPTFTIPPPPTEEPPKEVLPHSPSEKTYSVELKLPSFAPPKPPRVRELDLKRQPAGDFGFTLRRGNVIERGPAGEENKKPVVFAEPGTGLRNVNSGLLPGDRLVEVNGTNVEHKNREQIIELIRKSKDSVNLKVQPIPELSELSMRSGLDGRVHVLSEQNVKAASLQRSGSKRYKKAMAKTEDQIEIEKAWLDTEKVWLIHKGGYAGATLLKSSGVSNIPEGHCKVKLEHGGEILEVDEDDVEKCNPPQFDRAEDLASLRFLNESSVLHTIRQRFGGNLMHTYGGPSMIVVNPMHPLSVYSEKVIMMFKGCKQEDMPPHIYASAQTAYRNMLATRHDQSLVFMGASGSCKTTNVRHTLHYLTLAAGGSNSTLTVEKLNAVTLLLEAFGNSRTVMNTNATRFTQITSLDFDRAGLIASASVQILMLEKNRVARRPEGEPTFHIFYQLIAGIDTQLRNELQLTVTTEPNLFMTPLQRTEDKQRATQNWAKIQEAMTVLGIKEDESKAIYSVLAAIYHLGSAGVMKGANNKPMFAKHTAAQKAASLLGTEVEELSLNIFSPSASVSKSGSLLRSPSPSFNERSADDKVSGIDALEGFVVGLYAEAVGALVSLINRSLSSTVRTISSILIVDVPGFQNPSSCGRQTGASFEELCHNYTQERLQLLFHDVTFTNQLDRYAQENIECDFEGPSASPAPLVSLIDKPTQQGIVRTSGSDIRGDQRGLLWLLDEEAIFPGSNDESFMERLMMHHGDSKDKRELLLKKGTQSNNFILSHQQGTLPIEYNATGWLKHCRENPITRQATAVLLDSNKENISAVFSSTKGSLSSTVSGSVAGIEGTSSLRRVASMRRTYTTGAAGLKRKSICLQVKFQVDSLVDTIRRTRLHFVFCLLPQHNGGLCDLKTSLHASPKADELLLNVPLVRSQVRGLQLMDAIRIYRQGYPGHMLFNEFRRRFELLAPAKVRPQGPVVDEKEAVEELLGHLDIEKSSYRLGLSQVFFRAGALAQLEDAREEKIAGTIVAFQAYARGYVGRLKLKKLKVQALAVTCIQRNVRKFMKIREWTWWRLYTKVLPLVDVTRTEEDLKAKEIEVDQLKTKLEKLDKERSALKITCEKLENKLAEMTADLTEEHTTSSHATDVLEAETAERLRLEKELKDLQTKHSAIQRKNEQLEMEVMQSRMWSVSTMDGEFDDEDADGDSLYKERYERAMRELDFQKKRLKQQSEEEVEQEQIARKHAERKLHEAQEESEELQHEASNLKRKSQRLTQELQDMKLHLEEQVSRNSELEKKQRKFDSEVHRFQEEALLENSHKDKLQRERDQNAAEKYALEKEVESLKMDLELQQDKIHRLQNEVSDLSSLENKDDSEVVTMKRSKHELELKLKDQEEELDEQAGQIQMLEQAKLRLEMNTEKQRQQHQKELDDRETEMEDARASFQRKMRTLEAQTEDEYEEKQQALREKRDLEAKLKLLEDRGPMRDRDNEKLLRKDLKKAKALLHDAQNMLEKQKQETNTKGSVRQLRNQLEDQQFSSAAATKAKKALEIELEDLQLQLEEMTKAKTSAEDRAITLQRQNNDLKNKLEENDEEMLELEKKYKAVVAQQSVDQITLRDQASNIGDLEDERQKLKETVSELQSRVEYLEVTYTDKQKVVISDSRVRELETKLEFEQSTKKRLETLAERLKEDLEVQIQENDRLHNTETQNSDVNRRLQKQLRELREEFGEVEKRELEGSQKKHELELHIETVEADLEQSQSDLKLAFKRISDLQAVIEDDMESDSELSDIDGYGSDLDVDQFLKRHVGDSDEDATDDIIEPPSGINLRTGGRVNGLDNWQSNSNDVTNSSVPAKRLSSMEVLNLCGEEFFSDEDYDKRQFSTCKSPNSDVMEPSTPTSIKSELFMTHLEARVEESPRRLDMSSGNQFNFEFPHRPSTPRSPVTVKHVYQDGEFV